jgi:hypothetical protein
MNFELENSRTKTTAMKVYEISELAKPPKSRFPYYSMLVAEDEVWKSFAPDGEAFNGIPFATKWKTPTFYIEKPLIPKPNFFNIGGGAFVCDEKARELAGEPMEMSGEFLPINVEGEKGEYWIYNVTNTINVVDIKKSKWEKLGPGPDDRMLKRPAFIPSRFTEETIFKIPEDRGARMYCVEFTGDPDDGEFKAVVEYHGLRGLLFEQIWTDEK